MSCFVAVSISWFETTASSINRSEESGGLSLLACPNWDSIFKTSIRCCYGPPSRATFILKTRRSSKGECMIQLLSKWSATVILASAFICPSAAFGQSASNAELLSIIKKLEARIAELEAKTGTTVEPVTAAKPATEASEATVSELKKDVEELKKKDTESAPILDFFKKTQVTGYVD